MTIVASFPQDDFSQYCVFQASDNYSFIPPIRTWYFTIIRKFIYKKTQNPIESIHYSIPCVPPQLNVHLLNYIYLNSQIKCSSPYDTQPCAKPPLVFQLQKYNHMLIFTIQIQYSTISFSVTSQSVLCTNCSLYNQHITESQSGRMNSD